MAGFKEKLKQNESIQNISHVRTPTTPQNRYKRRGLLIIGILLVVAGIVVIIVNNVNV